MPVDSISMYLLIFAFKMVAVKNSIKLCISVHEDCFYISK